MTGAFINSKRRHLPELAGLRAVAALGIVVTHVAFQTGTESALFARFDYFVSVFFALSAFLLARGQGRPQHYFTKRVARIAPATWCVSRWCCSLFPNLPTSPGPKQWPTC
ncbi:acyltransferase family protein [Corynebacterium pilosum]|uniref:acyltransferase family protein n=1 Tax=Corynebacterium pilosum TaxID=35756 RepID=UPI000B0C9C6F|nr:acyltransferase family protein [Corynebacterium pilosum]